MSDHLPDLEWVESGQYGGGKGLSQNGVRRIYGALCTLALARGSTPERKKKLAEWKTTLGVAPDDAELLETLGRNAQAMKLGLRPAEQDLLLRALIDVTTAGGVAPSSRDEEVLLRIARRFGKDRDDLTDLIADSLRKTPRKAKRPEPRKPAPRPLGLSGDGDSDLDLLSRQADLRLLGEPADLGDMGDLEVLPDPDEQGFELLDEDEDSDEEAATKAMLAEQLGDSSLGLI